VPTPAEYRTRGVVVAVDAGIVTLEHEAVPALKWPPMTMPFKLADRALAKSLKKGQTVEFSFAKEGDDWVLRQAAPASAASGASR
jgi:membrane fusion protein, copper/silver efflux system